MIDERQYPFLFAATIPCAWSSITIGCVWTPHWVIDLRKNSSRLRLKCIWFVKLPYVTFMRTQRR